MEEVLSAIKSVRIQRIVAQSLDTADLAQIFAVAQQRQPVDQPVRLLVRVPEAVGEALSAMGSVPTLHTVAPSLGTAGLGQHIVLQRSQPGSQPVEYPPGSQLEDLPGSQLRALTSNFAAEVLSALVSVPIKRIAVPNLGIAALDLLTVALNCPLLVPSLT